MKRFITIAILLLPALLACNKDSETSTKTATSVVLSTDKLEIQVGESATLTATVLPVNVDKKGVTWSVLDEEYVEVKDGTVTGKAEGVTYVIATSADGYQKAACMVSVNPPFKYRVSIQDENGNPLDAVYGYPGMTKTVVAVASDGSAGHSFTWSVDDESAATVDASGKITFGAVRSTGDTYVYEAQSYLKVVSEDGYGCRIPVRSSMLNGIAVDGEFYLAGSTTKVMKEGRFIISALYAEAEDTKAVPASGVTFELSNTTDFSISQLGDAYMLVTGGVTNVTSSLSVSLTGSEEKIEIARFKIDRIWPIKATLAAKTSSTLVYTWTQGVSGSADAANPYTISLYRDEDGTDAVVSYNIPAGDACWRGEQPRFVFSGLKPATNYWFKVIDTGGAEGVESDLIRGTTSAFTIVEPGNWEAAEGEVILAEDFSEMLWGADETAQAAGYDVGNDNSSSFGNREADSFVATTKQYAQRILTAQSTAKKEAGLRIAKWAQGQYARIYIGPGYLFLSTKSYGTHLVTPSLNNIPEEKTAKVKVTLHAAGFANGYQAVLAVQHDKSFHLVGSNTQTNKKTLDLETNVQTITFNGGITQLDEFTVELSGLVKGDRIAFGPTTESDASNKNMMLISDMTIQILEIN